MQQQQPPGRPTPEGASADPDAPRPSQHAPWWVAHQQQTRAFLRAAARAQAQTAAAQAVHRQAFTQRVIGAVADHLTAARRARTGAAQAGRERRALGQARRTRDLQAARQEVSDLLAAAAAAQRRRSAELAAARALALARVRARVAALRHVPIEGAGECGGEGGAG